MLFSEIACTPPTYNLFLCYPIVSTCRDARWLFFMPNKLFKDVIQYSLSAFESRMSSGDNEYVRHFPSNYKSSSVIISSPVDFCYSRNNSDSIRSLCHRTSRVHIFPFLPYFLATQIFPLPCPPSRILLWIEKQVSMLWCLTENLPMTLSTSFSSQHSSSGPIFPYMLCGFTLNKHQYTPNSSLSNATSFGDISFCLYLQRSLSFLPLAQSSYSICRVTESLVPLQHTGILLLFFSHCSFSYVHVFHLLSSSIHLRLGSFIDWGGISSQSPVKYPVCFQNIC